MKYTKEFLIAEIKKRNLNIKDVDSMSMKQLRNILADAIIKESKETVLEKHVTHQNDL